MRAPTAVLITALKNAESTGSLRYLDPVFLAVLHTTRPSTRATRPQRMQSARPQDKKPTAVKPCVACVEKKGRVFASEKMPSMHLRLTRNHAAHVAAGG